MADPTPPAPVQAAPEPDALSAFARVEASRRGYDAPREWILNPVLPGRRNPVSFNDN